MNSDPKQVKTVNSVKLHWSFKGSLDACGVPWAPKEVPLAPEEILLSCLQRYKGLLGFGFSQFIHVYIHGDYWSGDPVNLRDLTSCNKKGLFVEEADPFSF